MLCVNPGLRTACCAHFRPAFRRLLESIEVIHRISDALVFLKDLAWKSIKEFQSDGCPQLAASITYYVIFSIFPLLIFMAGAVGLFLNESAQRDIVDQVLKAIPLDQGQGRNSVDNAVRAISGSRAPVIGLIGLVGMAWSGSNMFGAIRRALNLIFDQSQSVRPFIWQKAVDLSLVLGLGVFIGASIAASATLRVVQARSEDLRAVGQLSEDLGFAWTLAEYLLPFFLSLAAFMILYTLVPSRDHNVKHAFPGALVAALLFEVIKFGFSFYVTNISNFDLVFGSLGAVATFMFWVYLSSQIMLFGAEVAAMTPTIPLQRVRQPRLEGMSEPLQAKVLRAARGMFVRDRRG